MEKTQAKNLSVIMPVFNEEETVKETISELKMELSRLGLEYEIIVINDGSRAETKNLLEQIEGIKLISHPYNKGYGASLKTGIKEAKYEWLFFVDGDGQHPVEEIKNFLPYTADYDLITGARIKKGYKGPIIRQPGKKLLHSVANYLTGRKIPDLNCGFRLVKKNELEKFLHIMPNGFSMSTTTTLTFIKDGLSVKFVPIAIKKRTGKSTVSPKDAFRMLLLIIRIIMLFSPLKVFFPISLMILIISLITGAYDIFWRPMNITDTTILLFLTSIIILSFGFLADQLAAIRREIK